MKFLFTTNPLTGHLLPMVPLMRAAQDAGHEVIVASGPDLADQVHRHGLPFWAVGPTLAQAEERFAEASAEPAADEFERLRRDVTELFARTGAARARQLTPMAAAWRPDVVVHELTESAGWEAAAASGALDVVHGFGTHVPYLPQLAQVVCDVTAAELGTPNRADRVLSTAYIDPCPAGLQPPDEHIFSHVIPQRPEVGAVYPGEVLPEAMARLPFGQTIYLTLGTAFNAPEAWRVAFAAVRDLEVNVIATVGADLDPAAFGPLPAHIAVERFVPQALVLPHCAAVVSHTGSGTMLGALATGLPQVCLPIGADQFANAEQVQRTGSGVVVAPDVRTPAAIRAAIIEVLDQPAYAVAARRIQAEIAGLPTAADTLATLVALAAGQQAA